MGALNYLLVKKFTARIRNIYRKPLSAVLTTLGILFFVAMVVLMISVQDSISLAGMVLNTQIAVSLYSAFVLLIAITMAFQRRTSLMTAEDAANILPGPFSRKTVLRYILLGSLQNGLMFSLGSTMYLFFFASMLNLNLALMILLFVGGTMIFYFVIATIDYFYLMSIASPKFNVIKKVFYGIIVLAILAIAGINFVRADFDLSVMLNSFISDSTLDMIPVFGWLRFGISSFMLGDYLWFALAFGGILLACIIVTMLVTNFKHDFYEQVTKDAEWYATVRQQAKEGRTDAQQNKKVREVSSASFGTGASAISSNVFLQMKKTNNWIGRKDIMLVVLYLAIAYFGQLGFGFYQYYILIIVFTTISSDSIMQELKQPYIYLIPDKPLKKLIHLLLPITIKTLILVVGALALGWLAFQASPFEFITALLTIIGYTLVLIAGSVWSLRLLKSRSNAVSEQFIKMGIIILALLPAIIASVIVGGIIGWNNPNLMTVITFVSLFANIVVGTIFTLLAKSLLNGTNIMAD